MAAGLSPAERTARGKKARATAPRKSQAEFEPAAGRPDPVIMLEQQATSRVPELLPIRYGRMIASPFAFYRGGALLMASDLAGTPVTGITVQACGDAHLSNFGIFASPQRRLVFDVNDFDETLPGPWEWDIKRLATSIEIAGRGNGLRRKQRRDTVLAAAARYRVAMRRFAGRPELDVWYAPADIIDLHAQYQAILGKPERKLAGADLARLRDRDGMHALSRMIRVDHGEPRFVNEPPLLVPVAELPPAESVPLATLDEFLGGYRAALEPDRQQLLGRFRVLDAARKVVGVGSVGMRCWIILLTGRDPADVLVLQAKEAVESVLSRYVPIVPGFSGSPGQGARVVAGQRLMQEASDIFLGWARLGEWDCYVRQLRDWKSSVTVEAMGPRTMRSYGELCGQTLARAHARSGDRIAIAAYLGGSDVFDQAIADFAVAYADQNERDYARLQAAVAAGQVAATRNV